ncbi:MAG TPA: phospholipase [Thermoleophilia bacterium]|nr:phospholipase [Thermoleophilia bacterium]
MSEPRLVYRVGRRPAQPAGALVLLHGRGADELDLVPLLDELDPDRRLIGITLRAPLRLGPLGYHWYVSREVGYPDPATFLDTYGRVGAWLDELPALTGVDYDRTVLGGFSQGAVMSYALALGRGRPSPAALVALSGFIPEAPGFELDPDGHRELPVWIGHGTLDPVMPIGFGRAASGTLRSAGLDVDYRESVMGHTIDPGFVDHVARSLGDVLPGRQAA